MTNLIPRPVLQGLSVSVHYLLFERWVMYDKYYAYISEQIKTPVPQQF